MAVSLHNTQYPAHSQFALRLFGWVATERRDLVIARRLTGVNLIFFPLIGQGFQASAPAVQHQGCPADAVDRAFEGATLFGSR